MNTKRFVIRDKQFKRYETNYGESSDVNDALIFNTIPDAIKYVEKNVNPNIQRFKEFKQVKVKVELLYE